ncbi:Ribosomal silencing factor RsfS [bioreactor metagenome]|uniref:Ribosomal silencing factor RsfS n=1 Tax=bioreactor metagenome TaxID=1076179 RepID=A0A644TBX6_9ZZZZ|nr:ribosome silencing factor [Negativicutes bacterium]
MTDLTGTMPQLIAAAASDKKAFDIQILDMRNITLITDYFIICSANSTTQAKAIADHVDEKLAEQGFKTLRREGYSEARWILLDFGGCVVHIFLDDERRFYNIERLWGEAKTQLYDE